MPTRATSKGRAAGLESGEGCPPSLDLLRSQRRRALSVLRCVPRCCPPGSEDALHVGSRRRRDRRARHPRGGRWIVGQALHTGSFDTQGTRRSQRTPVTEIDALNVSVITILDDQRVLGARAHCKAHGRTRLAPRVGCRSAARVMSLRETRPQLPLPSSQVIRREPSPSQHTRRFPCRFYGHARSGAAPRRSQRRVNV